VAKQNSTTLPPSLPLVLRSRRNLLESGAKFLAPGFTAPTQLPITADGTTYSMAQEATWLDANHFAVGRWDGSLTVFAFNPSAASGPVITTAVSSPVAEGIQMIVWLSTGVFATSNDDASLIVWQAASQTWSDLRPVTQLKFDPALGMANSADSFTLGTGLYLVVGHANGFISIWSGAAGGTSWALLTTVDVRAAHPVNPWGLHNVRGVSTILQTANRAYVVSGSEDGNLCVVSVPDGQILSTTVYNPAAERGINSVAAFGQNLLVANCSVGPNDKNLWFYRVDLDTWQIALSDSTNLRVNPSAPQVFNFCTVWGLYQGGVCFFASTEEGALWMGNIQGGKLNVFGYQEVSIALGAALAFNAGGQLVMINYNLYEFVTANGAPPSAATNPELLPASSAPR